MRAWAQNAVEDVPRSRSGKGDEKIPLKFVPFSMTEVQLRRGPLLNALEINQKYLHSLPNDRLLYNFRMQAGLPNQTQPLGGWEDPKCELRGHFTGGHYLSAAALMYASSADEEIRNTGNAMVAELAKCQASDGYLSAFPQEFFVRLKNDQKVWAPFYTYHKIMAGHLDMFVLAGNEQALQTAEKMAGWVAAYLGPVPDSQWRRMQKVEFGGMNEVLYNLYAVTGKEEYLTLGQRFDDPAIFDPLAAHQDRLSGHHANTNIPKIIGAARAYELTGDARYRQIAEFFWDTVTTDHAYCTGGTSNDEFWHDPGKLSKQLGPAAEECCCSYNMLKLSRHLYSWSGDPHHMDYYERVLYNARLGTQDPDGMLMYYLPLDPGMWKTFGTALDSFWCCTGTGVEEYSKTNNSIYWHDGHGVYVNLFAGSELNWKQKRIRLVQETTFPEEQGTRITVHTQQKFPLHVRIPYWATREVAILVNGQPQAVETAAGSYATLNRHWRDGDVVEVKLPMHLHAAPLSDAPELQAAMYGPLVLAAQLGDQGLSHDVIYGTSGPTPDRLKPAIPEVNAGSEQIESWLEPVQSERLAFETTGQQETVKAIPLYRLIKERYSVYWKVNGPPAANTQADAAAADSAVGSRTSHAQAVSPS